MLRQKIATNFCKLTNAEKYKTPKHEDIFEGIYSHNNFTYNLRLIFEDYSQKDNACFFISDEHKKTLISPLIITLFGGTKAHIKLPTGERNSEIFLALDDLLKKLRIPADIMSEKECYGR